MSDLVENLRLLAAYKHSDQSIGAEAADEIERLTAGINKLVYLTKDYEQQIEHLRALVGEMRGELDRFVRLFDGYQGLKWVQAREAIAKADEVLK